jgi:hypothetical protein
MAQRQTVVLGDDAKKSFLAADKPCTFTGEQLL